MLTFFFLGIVKCELKSMTNLYFVIYVKLRMRIYCISSRGYNDMCVTFIEFIRKRPTILLHYDILLNVITQKHDIGNVSVLFQNCFSNVLDKEDI